MLLLKTLILVMHTRMTVARFYDQYYNSPYNQFEIAPVFYDAPYSDDLPDHEEDMCDALTQILGEAAEHPDPKALDDLISEAAREEDYLKKGEVVIRGGKIPGAFALSFDEGPSVNIPLLLDVLKECGISCGFYVDPFKINVTMAPLVRDMIKAGHVVGMSVVSSTDLTLLTENKSKAHITEAYDAFFKKMGWIPQSIRLPRNGYSYNDVKYCMDLGLLVCEPNLDTCDFANRFFMEDLKNSLSKFDPAKDSLVLVLRDVYATSVHQIKELVLELKERGYTPRSYSDVTGLCTKNIELMNKIKTSPAGKNLGFSSTDKTSGFSPVEKILGFSPAEKILGFLAMESPDSLSASMVGGEELTAADAAGDDKDEGKKGTKQKSEKTLKNQEVIPKSRVYAANGCSGIGALSGAGLVLCSLFLIV